MKYHTATAIIGPNSVGKTAVAFELARRVGVGEVVNLDTMYLFRHFPISAGLTDALKEKGVKRHLYELLEPDEKLIPADTYVEMVRSTCAQILSGGGLSIIEGGSTTYFPALFEANRRAKFCRHIIGLRPPPDFDLRKKLARRIDAALGAELIAEVREGLKRYRNTFIMTEAYSIVPIVRYLDGVVDLDGAKEEIIALCLDYARRQMELFARYPGITWLEHESVRLSQTVEKILTLINI